MNTVSIERLEALRVPLRGYCYRLLGSATDSDDAAQEALIRAAAKLDEFDEGRARLSTWVHRIATNVCLDMLRGARRRALAVDVHSVDAEAGLGAVLPADRWIEPMPGSRVLGVQDPGELAQERESVRLALIVALQRLTPRQRAVLVLRDVLAFSALETAMILDSSVPAVTSSLQRARASLREHRPDAFSVPDPDDPAHRDLLRRYVRAFEAHDVDGLVAVLREDAVASMPPFPWRADGSTRIATLMADSRSCAGARLMTCDINGGTGFGQYRPDDDGHLRPFALMAVEIADGRIARLVTFLGTEDRFAEFGLPPRLREEGAERSARPD